MGANFPKFLIMHCSDSPWGNRAVINEWHKERGWPMIGYHFVIQNGWPTYTSYKEYKSDVSLNGNVEAGRTEAMEGAHALGFNMSSLGICLIGAHGVFKKEQFTSAYALCKMLMAKYSIPVEHVLGHYETPMTDKICPTFDMDDFRAFLRTPGDAPAVIKAYVGGGKKFTAK